MRRVATLARRYGVDAVIVLVALEASLEVALRDDALRAPRTTPWVTAPAVALVVLPLLARRIVPFAAPAGVWLLGSACAFVDGRLIVFAFGVYVAGMAAAFLLGCQRDAAQARAGLAIVVVGSLIVVFNQPDRTPADFVFVPALFAIAWLAGFAVRAHAAQAEAAEERAARAEREREAVARVAVAEERARIARELHDVVAHAVSVMVLQVGAVRHRLPPARADDRDALRDVEQAGRDALGEMRRLLGALDAGGGEAERSPQPGLDHLDALVAQVSSAGLPVRARIEGDPFPLPRAIDLSAYRIVQEGLTNSLKHARASRADVTVRYATDGVALEVRDDGVGVGVASSDGLGRGLLGIRERVKVYGGEMSAGAVPGGGFVLIARLPVAG